MGIDLAWSLKDFSELICEKYCAEIFLSILVILNVLGGLACKVLKNPYCKPWKYLWRVACIEELRFFSYQILDNLK